MTRRDVALITLAYLLWLGAAYALNVLTTGAQTAQDVLHNWVRFDGIYFRVIAEHGYTEGSQIIRYQQGFPFLTAAFPLFPVLIRLIAPLLGSDYTMASVVVPQVLTWLVLLALFRLVLLDFSRTAAYLSIASLITFPVFYFLLAPYSETVFLLLTILTFDGYRRQRFPTAGLAGALASAARIVGAPLLIGALGLDIAVRAWRERRRARDVLRPMRYAHLGVIPVGLVTYMAYQWRDFGNPLMFLRGHASTEWKVGFDLLGPLRGLLLPVYTVFAHDWAGETFRTNLFNAAFLYGAIGVALYAWRKLPFCYSAYSVLAILLPMFSGTLISMPRFLLISFPLFVSMGLLFEAHPRSRMLLAPLAAAGLVATHLFFRTVFLG
jgi:hypothetical protein